MSPIVRLLSYIKKRPFFFFISLICALIYIISMVLVPLINGLMVDSIEKIIQGNGEEAVNHFLLLIFIDVTLIVLVLIFEFAFEYIVNIFVESINKEMRDDLFTKINHVSIKFIDSHSHGDLVSRCITDTDNVNNALISGFKQFYQGIIQIVATLIIMFIFNWILGLVVVFLTPVSFLISFVTTKKSKSSFRAQAKIQGDMSGIVLEDFNNIDLIKSFNFEDEAFNKYKSQNDKLYVAGQKSQFISSLTNPLTRLINNFTYVFVGVIAAILCAVSFNTGNYILGANCTVGTILTFIQYSNQFAKPFNEISSCLTEVQTGYSSLKRINEILNTENDVDNGVLNIDNEIKTISFNNVSFSYDPTQKLIEDFNLTIHEGQKVAIVGPTGCGKTTIINLILRFYDQNSGEIKYNSTNNLDIKKSSLRNTFGMVLQDTWIFHGTVLENIKYAKKDATIEEVEKAASRANALNFIKHLPKGFNTVINDNSGLSVGEKQLICISRVMLVEPKIMILDEATSNIDTRAEMKISSAFNKMMENKTSFVIAHRLSTIKNSDLIIVMNKGHIIETGTHNDLLNKKGFYYELYNAQYSK